MRNPDLDSCRSAIREMISDAIRGVVQDETKNFPEEDDGCVYIDDITGTVGAWLSADTSEIPPEALSHLREAYEICVDNL